MMTNLVENKVNETRDTVYNIINLKLLSGEINCSSLIKGNN